MAAVWPKGIEQKIRLMLESNNEMSKKPSKSMKKGHQNNINNRKAK